VAVTGMWLHEDLCVLGPMCFLLYVVTVLLIIIIIIIIIGA